MSTLLSIFALELFVLPPTSTNTYLLLRTAHALQLINLNILSIVSWPNHGGNQEEDAGYEGGEGQSDGQMWCLWTGNNDNDDDMNDNDNDNGVLGL